MSGSCRRTVFIFFIIFFESDWKPGRTVFQICTPSHCATTSSHCSALLLTVGCCRPRHPSPCTPSRPTLRCITSSLRHAHLDEKGTWRRREIREVKNDADGEKQRASLQLLLLLLHRLLLLLLHRRHTFSTKLCFFFPSSFSQLFFFSLSHFLAVATCFSFPVSHGHLHSPGRVCTVILKEPKKQKKKKKEKKKAITKNKP